MDRSLPDSAPTLEPGDYYMEGPLMVFTAAYHLKRGFCCGSGCRHCPYRDKNGRASDQASCADHSGPTPRRD